MSIIQDLYTVYDKEQAKYRALRTSRNRLLIELQHNLAFLREGLREGIPQQAIVKGLGDSEYRDAGRQGLDLNSLQKKRLARETYAGIREFDRYRGWSTARLVETVYERIDTLKRLIAGATDIDLLARLRNLFKLMMILVGHIQGRRLSGGEHH